MLPPSLAARLLIAMAVCIAGTGCGPNQQDESGESARPIVAATIFPLFDLTKRLGGDDVDVRLLLQPGLSPHGYRPSPADAAILRRSELLIVNGGGVDDWIAQPYLNLERGSVTLVHLYSLWTEDLGEFARPDDSHSADDTERDVDPDHTHAGEGEAGVVNPHLWLVPAHARRYVSTISEHLQEIVPDDRVESIVQREAALLKELEALDRHYAQALAPFAGCGIITFHNAFNPLAEAYGLEVVATLYDVVSDQVTPARLNEVTRQVNAGPTRALFIEPHFSADVVDRLGSSVTVRVLDPLGNPRSPGGGYADYFQMMRTNLRILVEGLAEAEGALQPAPAQVEGGPPDG